MFNKKFTKKAIALVSAMAIVGSMSIPVVAGVNDSSTGTTTVTYNATTLIDPEGNGKWGVQIPAGINLTRAMTSTDKADIVLMGANGNELKNIFTALTVSGELTSPNGFKLKEGSKELGYEYNLGTKKSENATASGQAKTLKLDDLVYTPAGAAATGDKVIQKGTVALTTDAPETGKYTDTLTFKFTVTASTLKN